MLQTVHAVAPSSPVHRPVNALTHPNDVMEYWTVGMGLTKWNAVSNLAKSSLLKKRIIIYIFILQIKYYFLYKFFFSVIKKSLHFIPELYENNIL